MRFHPWLLLVGLGAVLAALHPAAGSAQRAGSVPPDSVAAVLPRLVDFGAGKCIPCKRMAPILDSLRAEYAGIVDVVFVDVWRDPKAGKPYRIRLIPTQIFFDRSGKEVFRHEGFFSKSEIERVFREKMDVSPPPDRGNEEWDSGDGSSAPPDRGNPGVPDEDHLRLGLAPARPPLTVEIVLASVACQCVKERNLRYRDLLHRVLDPYGSRIVQRWTDLAEDPVRADSLRALWGLEDLPAIALVDHEGNPYWGDDEELDLLDLLARIEEQM